MLKFFKKKRKIFTLLVRSFFFFINVRGPKTKYFYYFLPQKISYEKGIKTKKPWLLFNLFFINGNISFKNLKRV